MEHREDERRTRWAARLSGAQGLLVLGMWAGFIRAGVFKKGLRTVENEQYLGFHVAAEAIMGSLLTAGSLGMLIDRSWGRAVTLAGLGATIYSTVNSLADTVRNKPRLTPLLIANLLLAISSAVALVRPRRSP